MLRNVIAPIQAWLLSQGKCVGCGMPLSKAEIKKHPNGEQYTCKCRRVYIKDLKAGKFRRALLNEVK